MTLILNTNFKRKKREKGNKSQQQFQKVQTHSQFKREITGYGDVLAK